MGLAFSHQSEATSQDNQVSRPLRVAFVSPNPESNDFWRQYSRVMRSAAHQLGIKLYVYPSVDFDRFSYLDAVERALENKPDYLVAMFRYNTSETILNLTAKAGVKLFSTNSDLPSEAKAILGKPRDKFPHWIGQTYPDDLQAGYYLAEQIFQSAKPAEGEQLTLIALAGSRDSPVAFDRVKGLQRFVKENPTITLKQIIYSGWRYETTYQMLPQILARYPDIDGFWSVSDVIAAAVDNRLRDTKATRKYIIGGFDWSPIYFRERSTNNLSISIGGHFIEGGIILALLNDYHHSHDFAEHFGNRITFKLSSLTASNKAMLENLIIDNQWGLLAFDKLSKQAGGNWNLISDEYLSTLNNIYHPPKDSSKATSSE